MFSEEVKEVCRDVIARVKSGNFIPTYGCVVSGYARQLLRNNPTQKTINKITCEACAKGSIFLSWIANNQCSKDEIISFTTNVVNNYPKELDNVFGERLLNLIEIAFELEVFSWSYDNENDYDYLLDLLDTYEEKYSFLSDKERLIEIMQDIINDEFVIG